jgi:hypothetical protein
MMHKGLGWIAVMIVLSGCSTANIAINRNFDFSRIKRVAVISFKDYPGRSGSGDIVAGAFQQSLLNAGYGVVERDQVAKILQEKKFTGNLEPGMAKTVGEILGVDALLLGQITDLAEPYSSIVKVDVVSDHSDPIFVRRTRRIQQSDGSWREIGEDVIQGYKTTHTIHREPRTYIISGRLGVSARLVYVGNGEILWSGSDSTNVTSFEESSRVLSDAILKALKSTWPIPTQK